MDGDWYSRLPHGNLPRVKPAVLVNLRTANPRVDHTTVEYLEFYLEKAKRGEIMSAMVIAENRDESLTLSYSVNKGSMADFLGKAVVLVGQRAYQWWSSGNET